MVRLQIGGIWIDMTEFDFELKWKHPIQNNLNGESSTYSTDMTVPLTANNKTAFDYKIFLESGKTNKYLYGQLIVNGSTMPIRCYIQNFSSGGIKFYLEKFRVSNVGNFLKDTTTLDNLFLPEIQSGAETDILMNLTTELVESGSLPEIFTYLYANGRPNVYAQDLLAELATFYGITLDNAPTNYGVFCNQWKAKTGGYQGFNFSGELTTAGAYKSLNIYTVDAAEPLYIDGITIKSLVPFKIDALIFKLRDITHGTREVKIRVIKSDLSAVIFEETYTINFATDALDVPFNSTVIPVGEYFIQMFCAVQLQIFPSAEETTDGKFTVTYPEGYTGDYPDFGTLTLYPCWQNLPKITAKSLFETIAICAGQMIEYSEDGTTIKFVPFEDVFSPANAIDVSDKLVQWNSKEFKFLTSNNATVNYADGRVIATVIIKDETLPTATNSVATIDAIRIQDEGAERNTSDLVLIETTDSHFDIIDKLPLLYAPLTTPRLFEAEFMYFADNKRPLLVRQLGGIFIALESIISTKNTITLKLLKIA